MADFERTRRDILDLADEGNEEALLNLRRLIDRQIDKLRHPKHASGNHQPPTDSEGAES